MPAEFTLLQQGKGSNASPFLPGGPVALQSCHHKTCRHSSERRKMTWPPTLWRLHLEDTSLPPPCLYLEVCSASHSLPWHIDVCARTHTHMQPTAPADWQELQTVQLHRLHFRSAATDWQPAEGWLLAGNTCFIYQPAGVCQAHYACDMGNLEVYFKWIEIMYYI